VEGIMSSKLFTTRQGTIWLGVTAAVIAAIALLVYLNHYRSSTSSATVQVLVAKSLIQKDTPGDIVGTSGMYVISNIPKSSVKTGAFVDPAELTGNVALTDIYPNQQITAADFGAGSGSVTQDLAKDQRAVVVSLGSPQEVGGQITSGSHVDFWVTQTAATNGVTRPVAKLVFQDMYVLNAGTNGGNVTLRATAKQAGQIIFASTNATIWLVLRPTVGTVTKLPPISSVGGG
jgi:pilus assembly protein CpaB